MTAGFESGIFQYEDGIPVHYQKGGHGPVPLIFLHGFASSHTSWHDIAGYFPGEEFSLYLLDLKGFGLSGKPRDGAYSIDDQAGMVRSFIRYRGFRSVVLLGHSLGGAVALRVCLDTANGEEPFTVEKLVLIDCAAYPQKLPKFFRRLRTPLLGPLLLRLMPVRVLVRGVLRKVFYDTTAVTPERCRRYAPYFRGKGILRALQATVRAIDPADFVHIDESYRTLAVPTLIIWGEEDRIIRLKNAYRLQGDITGARLKILRKCGHNPHEERPRETCAVIGSFLATD